MPLSLEIHQSAQDDLEKIIEKYKSSTRNERNRLGAAIGRIKAILDLMGEDDTIQDRLLIHTDSDDDGVNFKRWIEQYNLGNDLWRVKLWNGSELVKYRIIYAYEKVCQSNTKPKFHVLAIVDRNDFNYEGARENEISARIIDDYETL